MSEFSKVDIDLDEILCAKLVDRWLRDKCDPASTSLLDEAMDGIELTQEVLDKFWNAVAEVVRNEAIVVALAGAIQNIQETSTGITPHMPLE